MTRKLTVYQCWCGDDMAQSDSFFPTLAEARQHLREAYDVKGEIALNDKGNWEGTPEGGGFDVHLERQEITMSRKGLCLALEYIPNR